MGKDKWYFRLIEIGVIAKKDNELHLFYSIYLIFSVISKIYLSKIIIIIIIIIITTIL